MKTLYLAGATPEAIQGVFQGVRGYYALTSGVANSKSGRVYAEKLDYDPKKVDIGDIIARYLEVANPFVNKPTDVDLTDEHRCGIYYTSGEDTFQLEYYMRFLVTRGAEAKAAVGDLIVNDTIEPGREPRFMCIDVRRLEDFEPLEPEKVLG